MFNKKNLPKYKLLENDEFNHLTIILTSEKNNNKSTQKKKKLNKERERVRNHFFVVGRT